MCKLVICEKPSVAQSIARVLGAARRCDGYWEGGGYAVSWCLGHLVELAPPDAYGERYAKWRLEDLPILPDEWRYQVPPSAQRQFQILKALTCREDVTSLVAATDAGREGELIFRLVYRQCKCEKPFARLWISSLEEGAIRAGFNSLKPGSEYDALYEAALCRERADWLVGINASRLCSCRYNCALGVGRVMTPTLAMVVQRETAIQAFQPQPFYTVHLEPEGFAAKGERMKDKSKAAKRAEECRFAGAVTVKSVERREKKEKPPALYDLTSLQRDANRLLGYTAQQTLDYAQSLYEKKLVTYPRTDSRYLTEDMADALPELEKAAHRLCGFSPDAGAAGGCAQVIDGKRVTDHHAILPTRALEQASLALLPAGEQAVLRLIALRLVCALSAPCVWAETAVTLTCAGHEFKAQGKTVLEPGWRAWEDRAPAGCALPRLAEGDCLPLAAVEVKEGVTTPPERFTEGTLLAAMEAAGGEDMPEEAERRGLGTPATRAAILEKLVQKGFVERQGRQKTQVLVPTDKGSALIAVVPEEIQSAAMTAAWEEKLLGIERGQVDPASFMGEIRALVTQLVERPAAAGPQAPGPGGRVIGRCPRCGTDVAEGARGWFCANRGCRFVLWKDNAYFKRLGKHLTGRMAEQLVQDGRVKVKDCVSRRTGKPYSADVLLTCREDGQVSFQLDFDNGGRKNGGGGTAR